MDDEAIILLDELLRPAGTAPKLASHHADTPLHLAFSLYLFNNEGNLLLTKRSAGKKVWPGVWTNSVCGHPLPGESFPDAISRRALFELGIADVGGLKEVLPDYRYRTPPFNGIIENEFCPVFIAVTNQEPRLNPAEAADHRWIDWKELKHEIRQNPDDFSYWLKDQLPLLSDKISQEK